MLNSDEKRLIDKLAQIDNIEERLEDLLCKTTKNIGEIKVISGDIDKIIEEKTVGFPWLADAIAQYKEYREIKVSEYLIHKSKPAISSAVKVKEIAKEKRILEKQFRVTRNLIKYYESLFPWLPDFVGEDLDDLIESVTSKATQES